MGDAYPKLDNADDFDAVVDEVIAAAGGDLRKAILGLVRGQHAIEADQAKAVSAGYVRRNLPRS